MATPARDALPTEPVLAVRELRAYYQTHYFGIEREVKAVDDITLDVWPNEIYGLAGESSCGKTTLIKTIAGALRPPLNLIGGSVTFRFGGEELDIGQADEAELQAARWKHLAYIMQGSMSVLNPVRRVRQSFVDFAYRHMGLSKAAFTEAVCAHLQRLHLEPEVLNAFPHQLSGGMRQRVTIALATVCQPEFIIADEPTTALDVVVQKSVLELIKEVQQEIGSSLLFVTHDLAVHANLTDRLGIMYAGRLIEEGPTRAMFTKPLHPYTQHLIGSLPRIGDDRAREGIGGTPPNLADPPKGCRFHPRCPLVMERCRTETPAMQPVGPRPGRRAACFAIEVGTAS